MTTPPADFIELHDASRGFVGVFIGPELWGKTRDAIMPILQAAQDAATVTAVPAPTRSEPLADWEALLAYWDFPYSPSYALECAHCGANTEDWRHDEPRKFLLTAANLGGQATFECLACRARIIKRHFKKHVDVECRPFVGRP